MDNNGKSWTEKYRPETWSDLQGHNSDVQEIRQWSKNWSPGDQPILLVGKPGIGKTTIAQIISKTMGYPIQGINASSARKSDDVKGLAMSMASTPTDAERQLILLDEVDGMTSGRGDPLVPLTEELADPSNPIVMTANSKYDIPQSVKSASRMYELSLGKRSRKAKLRDIAEAEGVDIDKQDLDKLAERPDLRSAINDLQTWAEEDIPASSGDRTFEEDAFTVMENILRGDPDLGFGETPADMVVWLDENVKKEYRGLEATVAYDCIRRADKYAGYAQQTRNYGYWKYAGSLLEQVARVRLTDTHDYYINLNFPTWFRSSTPSPSDSKPIASVYRKLKDTEGGTFQFGGNYAYFRKVLLPMFKKMPTEKRKELAMSNGFNVKEADVLGLSKDDFDRWTDDEVPESRQEEEAAIKQESAMSW